MYTEQRVLFRLARNAGIQCARASQFWQILVEDGAKSRNNAPGRRSVWLRYTPPMINNGDHVCTIIDDLRVCVTSSYTHNSIRFFTYIRYTRAYEEARLPCTRTHDRKSLLGSGARFRTTSALRTRWQRACIET